MKLRAKRKIKDYKNKDTYLDAVYRNNKEYIDSKLGVGVKSPKSRFKEVVKEKMSQGMTVKKALDTIQKSVIFTSREEHNAQNALKALKKNKGQFNKLRKLAGWKNKIDTSKFLYGGTDGKNTIYTYGDVTIMIPQSPKQGTAGLTVLSEDEVDLYDE